MKKTEENQSSIFLKNVSNNLNNEQEIRKLTIDKINSGEYFKDSMKWYIVKFITPISERSSLITYSFFIFILSILVLILAIKQMPVSQNINYIQKISYDSNTKKINIREIENFKDDLPGIVLSSLAINYVKTRESYDYNNLKKQANLIKDLSSTEVFEKYKSYLSLENANSPILRYQKYAKRNIMINSAEFADSNKIRVYFDSKAYDLQGVIFENISWQAEIDFEKHNFSKLEDKSYNIKITNYNLTLIKNNI